MPSFRKPKGTVTRHPADFDVPNLFVGWQSLDTSAGNHLTRAFTNLDNRSRPMVVWGYVASLGWFGSATGVANTSAALEYGVLPGTSNTGSVPVDTPAVWGVNPTYAIPTIGAWVTTSALTSQFFQARILECQGAVALSSPFPLAIVPANYSFAIQLEASPASATTVEATFTIYFEMAQFDH